MSEREKDVLIQFHPKHERVRPQSAPHHHIRKMGTDEERIKIIDDLTKAVVESIVSTPMNNLRKASEQGNPDLLDIATKLFVYKKKE